MLVPWTGSLDRTKLVSRPYLHPLLKWLLVLSFLSWVPEVQSLTPRQLALLKDEAEDLFYHGFDNYMRYAFPEDELRPISCRPLTRDRENPAHIELNDVLGNYSLTLIDSLSTLAILASSPSSSKRRQPLLLFQDGVKDLVQLYGDGSSGPAGQGTRARGFDVDSKVQVFETVIRGLGGLLSAHLFAVGDLPIRGYSPPEEQLAYARKWQKQHVEDVGSTGILWNNDFVYDGQLLRLAYDLGTRLIPAFYTTTGIPYPRVNLRHGIPFYINSPLNFKGENGQCAAKQPVTAEITETCSAGAGSLVLEFTVLSRLTGDDRFEHLAKRAFWAIWNRRSDIGLIGAGIDAESGEWIGTSTGIGAGIDSFFEYALKSHILLSRDIHPNYSTDPHEQDPRIMFDPLTPKDHSPNSFLQSWIDAHAAIKRHIYRGPSYQHPHYIQADLNTGAARAFWIDSLSAYYPGLLTLSGHLDEAIETHLLYTAAWTRFSALPERWNVANGEIEGGLGWWPGRPEFIESTYFLYRATDDPWYVHVGEMVLRDIKRRCWSRCGWTGLQDVRNGERTDRMESFFLGETAKYLFLLFDPGHPLNHLDEPFVFSTEGHPLVIPRNVGTYTHNSNTASVNLDPQTQICPIPPAPVPLTLSSTAARGDIFHAAALARLHLTPIRENVGSVLGEYNADHPSISLSDLNSPSNYSYYPWTLPPELVPINGTSRPMEARPTFDISFPALQNTGGQTNPPLQRVRDGILVNFVGGLRLGMIQDFPTIIGEGTGLGYRIQAINNIVLGKDEKVFLARETGHGVLNPSDPNFTKIRDQTMLDLVLDLELPLEAVNETTAEAESKSETKPQPMALEAQFSNVDMPPSIKTAFNSLIAQLSSMIRHKAPQKLFSLRPTLEDPASSSSSRNPIGHTRYYISAITPTGIGAAPIPDWNEAPSPTVSGFPNTPPLQWTTIYATDELCTHRIPPHIARTHQILLIKRGGGCSFSQKLANIPVYAPSPTALQLVVVVSYGNPEERDGADHSDSPSNSDTSDSDAADEDQLVRPYLDEQQFSPKGLLRHNPIPMVMVGGGARTFDALRTAAAIGFKRRYSIHTRGIPIGNLIII